MSSPSHSARRSRRRRSGGRRLIAPALQVVIVVAAIAVLVPAAQTSLIIAGLLIGALGVVVLILAVGPERASWHLMVVAFFLAPLTNFTLVLRPFVFASAAFFAAVGLAVPRLLRVRLRLPTMFVVGAVLFMMMGILSTVVAKGAVYSLWWVVLSTLAFILIPVLIVWMRPTDGQMYLMMVAFAGGAAVSTLYGLLGGYVYRNAGFTYHPVALAYTCMLALSFVPFQLGYKPARSRWLVVPPLAAIALAGIWTSGSRTGVVVLAALIFVIPVVQRSIRLGLLVITGVVLALPVVMSVKPAQGSTSAFARLFGGGGASNSDTTRESTLKLAFEQIRHDPIFGNGYSIEHTYTIHNLYLQVLAAEGLIGLIGLLLFLAVFVSGLRKANALHRPLAYPALACVLAGPFQPNMTDHYLGMSLGLSLVAAVGATAFGRSPDDPDDPEAPAAVGYPASPRVSSTIS